MIEIVLLYKIVGIIFISLYLIYPISKYTTIGNNDRLMSYLLDKISDFKLRMRLQQMTYGKLFVCRPCHTFWMVSIMLFILYKLEFIPFYVTFLSFGIFLIVKIKEYYDKK